jgi:hypothetical protein
MRCPHRSTRIAVHPASPTPLDRHEPLDTLPPGIAAELLSMIDRAIDRDEAHVAARLERMLPWSMTTEPAVLDRHVTLRLLEGEVASAQTALDATPATTPRLDLLRAVVAIRLGDPLGAFAWSHGLSAARSLALRVVSAILAAIERTPTGYRMVSDPAPAVCAASRGAPDPTIGTGPGCIAPTLRMLDGLLGSEADAVTAAHDLAATVRTAIAGLASDLGLTLAVEATPLAVTPDDGVRLGLRAA